MRDKIFYFFLSGFAIGVFLRSFFNLGFSFSFFLLFLAAVIFLYGRRRGRIASVSVSLLLPVFIAGIGAGFLRFDASDFRKGDPVLDSAVEQKTLIQGVISEEPDERESSVKLTVNLEKILFKDKELSVGSKVLVTIDLPNRFHYGDRLNLSGILRLPKNYQNKDDPAAPSFDYISYLAKDGIYYEMVRPRIELVSSGNGNFVKSGLFKLKELFVGNVAKVIPEPHGSLLNGLVVGAKQSLGKNLLDDFRKAGIIHIVVLSGYNITIVAEAIMKFFSFLPRLAGFWFGAVGIVLFAIMTGGSATVVRASLMALLVIVARATGRKYHITRALLLAGFFMILQNPKILVFDSSFELSFMSTLALIYVSPLLEKYFRFIPEKLGFRGIVTATIATQIFVLPFLLYKMGMLSVVALPVNLLILPLIPATMLLGFLAGAAGFVWTGFSIPFAYGAYFLLAYELRVVEFFSHLPFASVAVGNFPLSLAVLCYVFYLALFWSFKKNGGQAKAIPLITTAY